MAIVILSGVLPALLGTVLPIAQGVAAPSDEQLAVRLAEAVDLESPDARRRAARALAQIEGVDLERWLGLCRAFAPRANEAPAVGVSQHQVPLWIDGEQQRCELFVYTPRSLEAERRAPVLVLLHGTGGSGGRAHQGWHAVAERFGVVLLAPTEPGKNEGFRGDDAERGAVLAAVRWLRRRVDVDEDAVFLSGNSRGGHLTWDLGARFHDRWAGLLPRFGGPRFELRGRQNNFRYLEQLVPVPLWAVQGPAQHGLGWSVQEAVRRLRDWGSTRARQEYDLPAPLERDGSGRSWQALLESRRAADGDRQILRAARKDGGRRGCLEITGVKRKVREVFEPRIDPADARRLDAAGLRRLVIDQSLARTARLAAVWTDEGLELQSAEVRKARVHVTAKRAEAAGSSLRIVLDGRRKKVPLKPSVRVLLEDFVERFDRQFLPVAVCDLSMR